MITAITALATKACELATKSHMLNFCKGLRGLCRDMLWLFYRNQQRKKQKIFSVLRKERAKLKTKRITTAFGKSLFLIKYRMRYAINMPPNTKYLAMKRTMVAYVNRQNATAFARANNSDLLRSLKQLMETRLSKFWSDLTTQILCMWDLISLLSIYGINQWLTDIKISTDNKKPRVQRTAWDYRLWYHVHLMVKLLLHTYPQKVLCSRVDWMAHMPLGRWTTRLLEIQSSMSIFHRTCGRSASVIAQMI